MGDLFRGELTGREIAAERAPVQRPLRAKTTAVAWLGHAQLSLREWELHGSRIGVVSKCTNWWLGDWVRFGQRHYGLGYREASSISGYDEQTLMNFAYVAGRYKASRRREVLSWSHHAEVAKLDAEDQDIWLTKAVDEQLSVRKLRTQLRQAERRDGAGTDPGELDAAADAISGPPTVCPHCGGMFIPGTMA